MGFSRAGIPAHLEPWRSIWSASGNAFEVNFVPDYKILHDAGYNVLAYDLRNSGLSGAANGGIASSGIFESRDVLGSLRYVRDTILRVSVVREPLGHPVLKPLLCARRGQYLRTSAIGERKVERAPVGMDMAKLVAFKHDSRGTPRGRPSRDAGPRADFIDEGRGGCSHIHGSLLSIF